ncbi:hypothetical protein [Ekhidna sp.]|uniref:hypothetical protein n=1 Tax=Ekhidna sp. TaxID=2608089 RepID=UPI003C7D5C18
MRIVLLIVTFFVLSSARFNTDGRSAQKEVQHLKGMKSNQDDRIDLNEPWPFKNTLSNADPNIVELLDQVEFSES